VISAVLAIGGLFFMRVILPMGLAQADAASREAVFLRCRRGFKIVIHAAVLFLLLTGAFNTYSNWDDYKLNTRLMHGLWGPHMLLGLIAIIIALVSLAPETPPRWHKTGATINLILLLTAVFLASTLKYVRDSAMRRRAEGLPVVTRHHDRTPATVPSTTPFTTPSTTSP
jgi:putative copper export protein